MYEKKKVRAKRILETESGRIDCKRELEEKGSEMRMKGVWNENELSESGMR